MSSSSNPCASCGRCCREYTVPVCGHDVWLISERQQLNPQEFVVTLPTTADMPSGFLLEPNGQYWSLALDKRGRYQARHACVFLVDLGGGQSRCGIYDHRPVVCQAYPMFIWGGQIGQADKALCPTGAWPEEIRTRWRVGLQRERRHFDVYHEVVAHWNARVSCARPGEQFSMFEYLAYLMNVYDVLGSLDRQIGREQMAHIEANWPEPGIDSSAPVAGTWVTYLTHVRQAIDLFYPYLSADVSPVSQSEKAD